MPFDLSPLWAGGEKGFQLEAFDLSSLRVGGSVLAYGTGPEGVANAAATTFGQDVFAIEDHKATIATGANILTGSTSGSTNGGFSFDGAGTVTRSGSATAAGQGVSIVTSEVPASSYLWQVEFTVSGFSGDPTAVRVGGSTNQMTITGNGTYRVLLPSNGSSAVLSFVSTAAAAGALTISGLTLKRSTQNSVRQSTAANRPTVTRSPAQVRNLLVNSAFDGATSGSPGSVPTGMSVATSSGTRSTTVSAAPTEFGGNKVRFTGTSARLIWNAGTIALKTTEVAVFSAFCEVHAFGAGSGVQARNIITFNGYTGFGASIKYYVDGVDVGGGSSQNVAVGLHTIVCIVSGGTSHGSMTARLGTGLAGAVSDDISIWAPQCEVMLATASQVRSTYQRTLAVTTTSASGNASVDVFEPVPGGDGVTPNVPHYYALRFDGGNDAFDAVWNETSTTVTVIVAGRFGTFVETVSSVPASSVIGFPAGASTYNMLGSKISNAVLHVGDVVLMLAIDRALTQTEIDRVIAYAGKYGAKGQLVLDTTELLSNPSFDADIAGWDQLINATAAADTGRLKITASGTGTYGVGLQFTFIPGDLYLFEAMIDNGGRAEVSDNLTSTSLGVGSTAAVGSTTPERSVMTFVAPPDAVAFPKITRTTSTAAGQVIYVDNASLKHYTVSAVPADPVDVAASRLKMRKGGTWVTATLKVRQSGAWVAKPVKVRKTGAWVT